MKLINILLSLFFLLALCPEFLLGDIPYKVEFKGIESKELLDTVKSVSQLENLQDYPPPTMIALNRRAEADIPNITQGLQTEALYRPRITISIDEECDPVLVTVNIDRGNQYSLTSFTIVPYEENLNYCDDPSLLSTIFPEDLGIELYQTAYPEKILETEARLVELLTFKGYPLAKIKRREVVADVQNKEISVVLYVDIGRKLSFGPTHISGLETINPYFLCKKIYWSQGDLFDPTLVNATQIAIEDSGLFSSVNISYGESLTHECELAELPMYIDLIESKHRTVGLGASYNTQVGPGVLAEWELRNMRGLGETFGFRADLWALRQRGTVLYRQPDFLCPRQDILWLGEFEHEKTDAFIETFFSLSSLVEYQIWDQLLVSYGLQFKGLDSTKSTNNGTFGLVKVPFVFRWITTNSLLDPTKGFSLKLKLTPTLSVYNSSEINPRFIYYIQNFVGTIYQSLSGNEKWVLACKVNLGSIFGSSDRRIPPPERLYAGNENTLRGYKYMTVSPIVDNKPIGGRSLMVFSAEIRARLGQNFGWVAFYEVGNVYAAIVPNFNHKQLQSVGFGIRYHTAVGPIRFDLAVPLDRRKKNPGPGFIDDPYEFYFSMGQAF